MKTNIKGFRIYYMGGNIVVDIFQLTDDQLLSVTDKLIYLEHGKSYEDAFDNNEIGHVDISKHGDDIDDDIWKSEGSGCYVKTWQPFELIKPQGFALDRIVMKNNVEVIVTESKIIIRDQYCHSSIINRKQHLKTNIMNKEIPTEYMKNIRGLEDALESYQNQIKDIWEGLHNFRIIRNEQSNTFKELYSLKDQEFINSHFSAIFKKISDIRTVAASDYLDEIMDQVAGLEDLSDTI